MAPYKAFLKPRQSLPVDQVPTYFQHQRKQTLGGEGKRPTQAFRTISWNPLGSLIATGSLDKTLRVWNPERPNVRYSTELKGHNAPIEKIAWNPMRDAELCSLSSDGTVKFWDVRDKKCVNEVKGLGDGFTLAWAPDGQSLVVGNKANTLYTLSPTSPTPTASHPQPLDINQTAFSWPGNHLFLSTGEGSVRVLSYPSFQPALQYPYDRTLFSPSSSSTTTTNNNHNSSSSAIQEYTLQGHTSSCTTVELSPAGRYLASGGSDAVICLWNTSDWTCARTLVETTGPIRSLSFTWDGCYIAAGSDEGPGGVDVYHCESGEKVHTLKTVEPARCVAWAPSRYHLAWAEVDRLNIWGADPERK